MNMSHLRCTKGQTLLFYGDSITDAGATNHAPPYGEGYLSMLRDILREDYPGHDLTFVNAGISGNTLEGLDLRWERDLLPHRPDWVFIFIGINDAHVTLGMDRDPEQRLEHFKNLYQDLIDRTREAFPAVCMVLVTPYYIDRETSPIYQLMGRYVQCVHDLGQKNGLPVVDTQVVFDRALAEQPPDAWSADRVHPFPNGHQLIADAILAYLETD